MPAADPFTPGAGPPHMTTSVILRRLAGVCLLILGALQLTAAEAPRKNFTLPGGDAAVTLKQFVEQSGEQVAYLVDTVRGVPTKPVSGSHTPIEALNLMLAGTPLTAVQDDRSGALTVSRGVPAWPYHSRNFARSRPEPASIAATKSSQVTAWPSWRSK